jgi:PAS domain S-box-containing protein
MPVPSELLDATSDGLLTLTADGRITYANARAAAMLGVDPVELVGRPIASFVAEDSPVRPAFSGRELSRAPVETKLQGHDGSARWVLVTESLVGREDNLEVLVTLIDHTQFRAFEEFLRQAQKFEALGRLASGIAHDFNNLITTMYAFCDLLAGRLPEADKAAHTYVEDLRQSAERAGQLSHQLLVFSRQQRLEPKLVCLDSIVHDTERMLIRIIGEDVHLIVLAAAGDARVHADPGQISQVLLNLAANARDAMPHGGTLSIETRTVTLLDPPQAPQVLPPGRYVSLIVSDTGLGIAPEVLPHIFEPFYTTKGEAGTGLGLATVFGIIRQSNGDILVRSGADGTAFELLLPTVEYPAGV